MAVETWWREEGQDRMIWHEKGLDARATNCLLSRNIRTLDDLCDKTDSELLAIPHFGQRTLNAVHEMLAREGRRTKPRPMVPPEEELASLYAKLSGHMQEVAKLKQRISALEAKVG